MEQWNGVGLLPSPERDTVILETDASGNWGCGQCASGTVWQDSGILCKKELLPIVLATAVWGKEWSGKVVKCYCDNLAVVEVLSSGYSKDSLLIHLLRCLFFITEHLRVQLVAFHCLWHQNVWADALSRNNYQRFIQASSSVDSALTSMPDELLSQPTQLDIASLDQIVHSLYQLGLAQSTQRTYAAGKNCYLDFCNNYGLTPLPVTEKQLCYFVGAP